MGERNILGPVRVEAVEIIGTGAVGMTEIDIVCTTETGATSAAGEVAVGISVSVATLGSLKVFTIRGMDMHNKGRPQQRGDIDTYV